MYLSAGMMWKYNVNLYDDTENNIWHKKFKHNVFAVHFILLMVIIIAGYELTKLEKSLQGTFLCNHISDKFM